MLKLMHRFLRAEAGTTAIEYCLLAALITGLIAATVAVLGQNVLTQLFQKIAAAIG
jgi:Flp pilus assembly pilin Flp